MSPVFQKREALFTEDAQGFIRWDFATGKTLGECNSSYQSVAASADGKWLLMAKSSRWWFCNQNGEAIDTEPDYFAAPSVRFLTNARLYADSKIWNLKQGKIAETVRVHDT